MVAASLAARSSPSLTLLDLLLLFNSSNSFSLSLLLPPLLYFDVLVKRTASIQQQQ